MKGSATHNGEIVPEALTRREREILGLLAQGHTAPEVAQALTLALSTVKSHIDHLYSKLGVNSRRQALARARELGWLTSAAAAPVPSTTAAPPDARHNLPQPLTRLIGREHDIETLRRLLVDGQTSARLLTLAGAGGTGKTRLALALAREVQAVYPEGVWLIELASLADGALVTHAVAAGLGLRDETSTASPTAGRPLLTIVVDFLRAKPCLLVLDNCEHLVGDCARLAEVLLQNCPRLQILATSREPLKVAGETVWPVLGLALPPLTLPVGLAPEHAAEYTAVQLFAERARAARPAFSITAQNAPSLAHVCRLLDGLPLAIELAAARVATLPVEQIAALLAAQDRFRLLTGGSRTALPRQQTLLATIEWSYQLLPEAERSLLRRLAVFAGGWTLAAAETVCAEAAGEWLPAQAVLESLGHLVAKSLVNSEPTESGEARFHMLETIREYALDKLEETSEVAAVRQRHLAYFMDLAERAEPQMRGPDQLAWYDRMEAEHDNLRRALEWAVHSQDTAAGLRLASGLHRFWEVRGNLLEAHAWVSRLLAGNPTPQPSAAWAIALARAAYFATTAGDWAGADALCVAGLAMSRQLGTEGLSSAAHALAGLAWIGHWQHSHNTKALQREALALFEQAGDDWGLATLLQSIGFVNKIFGDYPRSKDAYEQSLAMFERLGDLGGSVRLLHQLAELAAWHGEYQKACQLHKAAADQCHRLRDWEMKVNALAGLADALIHMGQFEPAMAALDESITLLRSIGHLQGIPLLLGRQADIAFFCGQYDRAETLIEDSRKATQAVSNAERDWELALNLTLANIERARGNPAQAVSRLENVLPLFHEHQHVWWTAFAQRAMGEALRDLGDYERATLLMETSLAFFRARDTWREVTAALLLLGGVARRQGDERRTATLLGECLRRCEASGLKPLMAACLAECAYLCLPAGSMDEDWVEDGERAATLLGAYVTLCETMGLPVPPADVAERREYERAVTALRTGLGQDRLDKLWRDGGTMSAEAAANCAHQLIAARQP